MIGTPAAYPPVNGETDHGTMDGMIPRSADGDTLIKPDVDPLLDDGDHDRFAHYVKKSDIVRANVEGVEVVALCGKKWIPNRDPNAFPVCPSCKEIMAAIRAKGSN